MRACLCVRAYVCARVCNTEQAELLQLLERVEKGLALLPAVDEITRQQITSMLELSVEKLTENSLQSWR